MTYIDSDGVISDFDLYLAEHCDGVVPTNPETAARIMVEDYKNCFLTSKELPNAKQFLYMLHNPDTYVLTALSRAEYLAPYCKDVDVETILNTHRENKYRWYEDRGISREKVIITDCAADKLNYCNPGDVLYDDRRKTIDRWNEKGGVGIYIRNVHWDH